METTTKRQENKPDSTTGGTTGQTHTQSPGSTSQGGIATGARTQQSRSNIEQTANDKIEPVKDTITDVYDKTSRNLNKGYNKALDYGRSNPGTTALITFGAGVGIGLLLAGGFSSRTRTSRILPPVLDAVSRISRELFR
jgi:hypothetical protein